MSKKKQKKKKNKYHFEFGDSDTGVIGACAVVKARSQDEAIGKLKDFMEFFDQLSLTDLIKSEAARRGIEYANVYINTDNIDEVDIDEILDSEGNDITDGGGPTVHYPDEEG